MTIGDASNPNSTQVALADDRHLVDRLLLGPPSISLRIKFFLTGCLFPTLCVAMVAFAGAPPTIDAPWQSGKLSDYIAVLLRWPCELVFMPLMILSIASLTIWTIWPTSRRYIMVRWGIYSGVPLAGQYLYFIVATSSIVTFVFAGIVAPIFAVAIFLIAYFAKRFRRFSILHLLLFTTVIAILCGIFQVADAWRRLYESPLIIAAATPTLNFITYVRATMMILREQAYDPKTEREGPLKGLIAFFALVATWAISWRIEIEVMLAEYGKLPTTDPNCYLSAAANHRHAWLFHKPHQQVSIQTKRLKFLEIGLHCAAPKFHAALRRIYDRHGPPLARFCQKSRWFADVTYLVLLPLEVVAAMLHYVIQAPIARIQEMYTGK